MDAAPDAAAAALRSAFLRELPARLRALQDGLNRVRLERSPSAVGALARHCETLRARAARCGSPRIVQLAADAEALAGQLGDQSPAPADIAGWQSILDVLNAELALMRDRASGGSRPSGDPAAVSERDVPPPAAPGAGPGSAAMDRFRDVLIVDGDGGVADLLSHFLRHQGLAPRIALTCADARAALDAGTPDGLIVDVSLPDGTGYDVVSEVRSRPDGDDTAVLVISRLNTFLDQAEAIRAGADACFVKPVDWELLSRRLLQLLERSAREPARVMLVEDDPAFAAFVTRTLTAAGYAMHVCAEPRRFADELSSFRPDLLLLDIYLPELSGHDLARYVRQSDQHATLPIIFITAETRVGARIRSVKAGGDDHLVKPVNPALLVASVSVRLERARFLRTLVNRDGLTQVLTHTAFVERVRGVLERKRRGEPQPAVLVMLDVDDFKSVNDSHGHQSGDRVLMALAGLLRRHVRRTDLVGRYGGDEFAILIDHVDEPSAVRLLQRLLAEFATLEHRAAPEQTFTVTFSAGVTELDLSTMDVEGWVATADRALYAAKTRGRGRVMASGRDTPNVAAHTSR